MLVSLLSLVELQAFGNCNKHVLLTKIEDTLIILVIWVQLVSFKGQQYELKHVIEPLEFHSRQTKKFYLYSNTIELIHFSLNNRKLHHDDASDHHSLSAAVECHLIIGWHLLCYK